MQQAEILRLMWAAHQQQKFVLPRGLTTKQQIIELARTATDRDGRRIVPREVFDAREVPMDARPMRIDAMPKLELPRPKASRAVLAIAVGKKPLAELEISGPLMREYADQCGADFIALTDLPPMNHGCAYKYALAQVARNYEQTLLLDADVIVMPGAPNIFGEVPVDRWGLVDDLQNLLVSGGIEWLVAEFDALADMLELPRMPLAKAWNSGLVIAPHDAHREYYPPPGEVPAVWCAEQHWHTYCLLQSGRSVDLDLIWQAGYPWINFPQAIKTAHFIHMNGFHGPHVNRLNYMRHFASGARNITPELRAIYDGSFYSPWWILHGH